jgi:hypothetical protein
MVGNGLSLASISPENRPGQVAIGHIDNVCLFNFISFFRKGPSPERLSHLYANGLYDNFHTNIFRL